MAKKDGDDIWKLLKIVGGGIVGLVVLDYLVGGRGKENNAALMPDRLEDQIDLVVEELNNQFGKQWVNEGLDRIQNSLQRALPLPLVAAVYAVELMSKNNFWPISGYDKKQAALRRLRGLPS
jgi:hypothetical protein